MVDEADISISQEQGVSTVLTQAGHQGPGFLASLQSHTEQNDREITEKTPSKGNHGHWIAGVIVVTTTPNGDP